MRDTPLLSLFERPPYEEDPEKWDAEHAEILVDGESVNAAKLSKIKKAGRIVVNNAISDLHFARGLEVDKLSFYACHGNIVLGKDTVAKTGIFYEECDRVQSVAPKLTCGQWLKIKNCFNIKSIGAGLAINPQEQRDMNFIKLAISGCPNFETLQGPATLNCIFQIYGSPYFQGLSENITQMKAYEDHTSLLGKRDLPAEWQVKQTAEWRDVQRRYQVSRRMLADSPVL